MRHLPIEPIIKNISKINFTIFQMEFRDKILERDESYSVLSFGEIFGSNGLKGAFWVLALLLYTNKSMLWSLLK